MKIKPGQPAATKLLNRLQAQGNLVDVYSKEFFQQLPTKKKSFGFPDLFQEDFNLVLEIEGNPLEPRKPLNHLLMVNLGGISNRDLEEFAILYPPLRPVLEAGHKPDFFLINLYVKKILCIGLGRKNQIFTIDADTNKAINISNKAVNSADAQYIDAFCEHDCLGIIGEFIEAVDELGKAIYEFDHLPSNPEYVQIGIDEGQNQAGLYYIRDYDGEIAEEDGLTKEEIYAISKEYKRYIEIQTNMMLTINAYFPGIDSADLDTGDYPV